MALIAAVGIHNRSTEGMIESMKTPVHGLQAAPL
jgi:hypothetical protein